MICLSSCIVDEQCRQNKNVELGITFFHVNKNITSGLITKTALSIDSITVKGLNFDSINKKYIYIDSIIYNNAKLINNVYLPLQKFKISTKYELKFNLKIDTITILHSNSDEYLSLECGCIKIHNIDTITTTNHFIDSVSIINHSVKTNNAENIRIYK